MNKKSWLITLALLAALVALFAVSFYLGSSKAAEGEEGFAGTDSVVVEMMEEDGAKPWFSPVFEPGSGEIESGLFALQAALGAGLVGFVFGNLRGRSVERERAKSAGCPAAAGGSAQPVNASD